MNRVVHKTNANCPEVHDIPPNERWYVKDIPSDGNYVLCAHCFPQENAEQGEAGVPEGDLEDVVRPLRRPNEKTFSSAEEGKEAKALAAKRKFSRDSSARAIRAARAKKAAFAKKTATKQENSSLSTKLLAKGVKTAISGGTKKSDKNEGAGLARGASAAVAASPSGKKSLAQQAGAEKSKTSAKSAGKKAAAKKASGKKAATPKNAGVKKGSSKRE